MKKFLKFLILCLCGVLTFSFGACNKPDDKKPENTDTFNYYPTKENMKTDGQFTQKEGIEFPASLWQTPTAERYYALDHEGVQGYFINSLNGTKVFCYVGIPETASAENKVPAVVLVHGATGTAYYDWVQMWTEKGYAAIAMDTEGRMPTLNSTTMSPAWQDSVREHGPLNQSFYDSDKPISEQWTYHALASVFASTSFIKSFEGVDQNKIGITGVSYGAYLTCLAAAYDDRYSFAAPVYGCLGNSPNSSFPFGTYMVNNGNGSAVETWDDESILKDNRTPFLFVSGLPDTSFGSDSVTRTAKQCLYSQTIFKPALSHGHIQGADIEEIFSFADEIFYKKNALIKITGDPAEGVLDIKVPKDVEIKSAQVYYTFSENIEMDTEWISGEVEVIGKNIIYDVDSSVKHYWVRVLDNRGFYACSVVS